MKCSPGKCCHGHAGSACAEGPEGCDLRDEVIYAHVMAMSTDSAENER